MTSPDLARAAKCTPGPITTLRRKGLLRARTIRQTSQPYVEPAVAREQHLVLNPDQQKGLDVILGTLRACQHRTILIHGVTGSGKTEVYIQAIQEVIRYGRQAIVLVPEISLTPQTVERFRSRFGAVAVLHSHLTGRPAARPLAAYRRWRGGRWWWGARSAIFAPTSHLGLIVLDEEHESSFKQETSPRYHARDVAISRAAAENVPLILGSATPSLESWNRARSGQYNARRDAAAGAGASDAGRRNDRPPLRRQPPGPPRRHQPSVAPGHHHLAG